jgi:hypothetical protein
LRLTNFRMSLLAAWLGLAIYFSAIVAPAAFGVLRSFNLSNANEIAGTIVSRALSAVNKSGLVISLLLLVTAPAVRKYYGRTLFIIQNVLIIVVAILTAAGEWLIAARMRGLRAVMQGHIDQIPLDDPNRMAFAALHGYSVATLGVAMIAALVAILLMGIARKQAASPLNK